MKSGYALFTTLHLSSPCIFWGSEIIPCSLLQPSLKTSAGHQWWPNFVISKRLSVYPLASGEEWWRVVKSGASLFTSRNPCVYRGFRRICEEWRVKTRVGFLQAKTTFQQPECFGQMEVVDRLKSFSRRIILCLAMAKSCPSRGQYRAIVRQ